MDASTWRWPTEFSGSSVGNRPAAIASVIACDTRVSRTTSVMPRLPPPPLPPSPPARSGPRSSLAAILTRARLRDSRRDFFPPTLSEQPRRLRREDQADRRPHHKLCAQRVQAKLVDNIGGKAVRRLIDRRQHQHDDGQSRHIRTAPD